MRIRFYELEEMKKRGCFEHEGYLYYDYREKIKSLEEWQKSADEAGESLDEHYYETGLRQIIKSENIPLIPMNPINIGKKMFSLGYEINKFCSFPCIERVTCEVLRR